ncbi:hypothetical protein T08_14462 [Trichinella sp. T8]|nr:hypothetical protein T08_14462 [Trichinella sp. T8]
MAVGKNALPSQWQWERQVPPLGHQNRQEALFLVPVIPMTHQWAQSNMSTYSGIRTNGRFHCQIRTIDDVATCHPSEVNQGTISEDKAVFIPP